MKEYTNYLIHHGVKGMKWGVRKADYNTPRLKSGNIYKRIQDLQDQEDYAREKNIDNYLVRKAKVKSTARQNLKANKQAYRSGNITRNEYKQAKASIKAGRKSSVRSLKKVYQENADSIERDFNKAYYKNIGEKHLNNASWTNYTLKAIASFADANSSFTSIAEQDSMIRSAKDRRRAYERDTARGYK